jgi:hypothetical protein
MTLRSTMVYCFFTFYCVVYRVGKPGVRLGGVAVARRYKENPFLKGLKVVGSGGQECPLYK